MKEIGQSKLKLLRRYRLTTYRDRLNIVSTIYGSHNDFSKRISTLRETAELLKINKDTVAKFIQRFEHSNYDERMISVQIKKRKHKPRPLVNNHVDLILLSDN